MRKPRQSRDRSTPVNGRNGQRRSAVLNPALQSVLLTIGLGAHSPHGRREFRIAPPPLFRLLEALDVERPPEIGGALGLPVFNRYAGTIGDLYDGVERREGGAGIYQTGITDRRADGTTRARNITPADHGLDEGNQFVAVWHATGTALGDRLEAVTSSTCFAALTEQ